MKNRFNSRTRSIKRKADLSDSVATAPEAKRAKQLLKGARPLPIRRTIAVGPPDAGAGAGKLSDDDEGSLSHELLNLQGTLKKQSSVDDDDDDNGGDYLFEHISSMKKVSKGGGRDTTTKSSAGMSTDIDSLATFVAQAARSMKNSSETTTSAPSKICRPPPDIDKLANLVASIARKHQKAKMTGLMPKLAISKKQVSTERRGHNTLMQVTSIKLEPLPWKGGMWPMSGIPVPGSHDCLIGRGGK